MKCQSYNWLSLFGVSDMALSRDEPLTEYSNILHSSNHHIYPKYLDILTFVLLNELRCHANF